MKSTGNDIIDLDKIDVERTLEYRFYSRILNTDEQSAHKTLPFDDLSFVHYVWLLWSVKESAYKYLKRLEPGLIFSPVNIVVSKITPKTGSVHSNTAQTSYFKGKVSIKHVCLFFESMINEQYISSTVNNNEDFSDVYSEVKYINNDDYASQSFAVRKLALTKLTTIFPKELIIDKSETGYPIIRQGEQDIKLPLSLAHHGNYAAFSFIAGPELLPA